MKNLELLVSEKKVTVGRELTKMYEEIVRGSVGEMKAYFEAHPDKVKEKFTIIVS